MGLTYSQQNYDKDRYTQPYLASQPADAAAGKAIAITGATGNGLGLKFAKLAASLGASKIILLNRPSERSRKALADLAEAVPAGCTVTHVDCDLNSLDAVKAAAPALAAQCDGKLDVLMLNSGIMASPDETTEDGYNREIQVNVIAQLLLLKLAMPLLEAAAAARGEARFCFQSSGARLGSTPIIDAAFDKVPPQGLPEELRGDKGGGMMSAGPAWKRYHQTKLANSLSMMILHEKLQEKGSKVKALCCAPGLAATDLQATTNKTGNMKAWETNLIFMLLGQSSNDGALPMTHACLMPGVESGSLVEPSGGLIGAYGLPICVSSNGKFLPKWVKQEKNTISNPEAKASFWSKIEAACGGPVV